MENASASYWPLAYFPFLSAQLSQAVISLSENKNMAGYLSENLFDVKTHFGFYFFSVIENSLPQYKTILVIVAENRKTLSNP